MTLKELFKILPVFQQIQIFTEAYNTSGILIIDKTKSKYKGTPKDFKHYFEYEVLKLLVVENQVNLIVRRI